MLDASSHKGLLAGNADALFSLVPTYVTESPQYLSRSPQL